MCRPNAQKGRAPGELDASSLKLSDVTTPPHKGALAGKQKTTEKQHPRLFSLFLLLPFEFSRPSSADVPITRPRSDVPKTRT